MNALSPIEAASASPHVFAAIAGVMADIAKEGIAKKGRNSQQGYNFRGIDDVYNALAPILAKHHLCIIPRVLSREVVERTTTKGGAIFYVTCQAEFTLISAEDGTTVTAVTFGEAMDSADKATNKAMSAAYKYMAMQTFCIPTEGDNDADATTHEVAAKGAEKPVERQHVAPAPPTLAERATRFEATLKGVKTADDLKKAYGLGGKLFDDLERSDPERRVELAMLYESRLEQLSSEVAQ